MTTLDVWAQFFTAAMQGLISRDVKSELSFDEISSYASKAADSAYREWKRKQAEFIAQKPI